MEDKRDVYLCVGGLEFVAPRGAPAQELLDTCRAQRETKKHTYCGLLKGWQKCTIKSIEEASAERAA